MPLERYHILRNEIDPRAVKVNSLGGTPLRPRERSPGQAFHVQSGKSQAWDCGKSKPDDFLEPVRQLVPILERLPEAGPRPVPGKAERGHTPVKGVRHPETKHINYLPALGPAELPSVFGWVRDPGSRAPLEWEQRFHICIRLRSERSRYWRATPRALGERSRSHGWLRCTVSRPLLCRALSC